MNPIVPNKPAVLFLHYILLVFDVLSGARAKERIEHELALLSGKISLILPFGFLNIKTKERIEMYWHNGYETKKLMNRLACQEETYRQLGMTEQQIQAIREFDLHVFLSDRRYREHTSLFEPFFDAIRSDAVYPLYHQYVNNSLMRIHPKAYNRFWWIDEMEDERILFSVLQMSEFQKTLLSLIVFDGFTQREVSKMLGISQSTVCRQFRKIKRLMIKRYTLP